MVNVVKLLGNPVQLTFTGGVNPQGAYNAGTSYVTGDSVSYNGSSYVAIQATTGNLPTNTTYWQLLASKGDTGATGATGPAGPGIPTGGLTAQVLQKASNSDYDTEWATVGALTDGDKGDITVSASGATWTIDDNAVTFSKIQDIGNHKVLGRHTTGDGSVEQLTVDGGLEISGSQIQRAALTGAVTASAGSNTTALGSFTLSQLNTALSDADVATGGGTATGTNTGDQNVFSTIAVSGQSNVVADSTSDTLTLVAGSNVTITTNATTDEITISASSGGVSDGDKGDITVSGSGATWTIDNGAVTLAKQADVATGTVFYRKTAGTGAPEVQTLATLKTDLGLSGTNTGDQTSIVGITGTKAQFDTAVTDGNFLYVGDVTQYTDEQAQDAVGAMVDTTLVYTDSTPLLSRAALTGAITASAGSNTTALGSFTLSQLNAALSDADVATGGGTATGTNTGDQTITLTGDVTGSGTGSFATTIANGAVDIAMLSATGTPSGTTYLRGDNTWATISAGGDVSKVGTPVNNQVGVWTGDGTLEGDTALTFDTTTDTLAIAASGKLAFGAVNILDDSAGTTTLSNIDALDATTEATIENAIDTLANLTSIQGRTVTLADAGADALLGWDDSASAYQNLSAADARAALGLATTDSPQFTAINLGNASDTTLTRSAAGVLAVEGSDVAFSANVPGVVIHGATAGTSRPSGYAIVIWIGSVEPTNAINNDMWMDTT